MSADEDTAAVDGVAAMRDKRERNRRERNKGGALPPRHPKSPTGTETPGQQGSAPPGETNPTGDSAGISASGKASRNAGTGAGVPETEAAAGAAGAGASQGVSPPAGGEAGGTGGEASGTQDSEKAGDSAGGKPGKEKERPPAPSTWRPSRRPGRPKGPDRIPLSVRILAEHDARLTQEVERQELSPQFIVDAALSDYFTKLDRRRGGHVISASENATDNNGGNAGG